MIRKEPVRLTKDFAKELVYDAIYDGFKSCEEGLQLIDSLSLSLANINVDSRLDFQIVRDMKCGETNVKLLNHLKTHYPRADKFFENENTIITHWCKFHHQFNRIYNKERHPSSRKKYCEYIMLTHPLSYKSDGTKYIFNHNIYSGLTVLLCFKTSSDNTMILDYIIVCAHT